ncbi:hypothetical protein ACROYT_G001466 [Oculina patagonica]
MPDAVEETSPQTQKTAQKTTRDYYEDFAEHVGEVSENAVSLPALAGEVAQAQKQQISELSKRQEVLDQLKLKIDSVKADVAAVSRKVYLTQDDVARKKANCEELEREIAQLVATKGMVTKQLAISNDKLEKDGETYKQYRTKMEMYAKQVEQYELDCPIYQSIAEQKARNAEIEKELERLRGLGDESRLESLRAEIVQEKTRKKQLEESVTLKQSELQRENERQAQLNREIETLHKRNKAQMTRLKCQIQEAVSRNQRWSDEACRLRQNIAEIKSKIKAEEQNQDDEVCQLEQDSVELESKMDD